MGEAPDGRALEGRIPGMIPKKVSSQAEVFQRPCVGIEDGSDFAHVGRSVIVLCSQGKFLEVSETRHAFGIKVPTHQSETFKMWVAFEDKRDQLFPHFGIPDPLELPEGSKGRQGVAKDSYGRY
jgi:hypothetical protein